MLFHDSLIPSNRFKSCAGLRYNFNMQPKNKIANNRAAIIMGFTMKIMTKIPIITNDICIDSILAFGNNSSMAPISFEKRFNIRPDGFVSKNSIGAVNNELNMRLCKFLDARIHKLKTKYPRKIVI